MQHTVHWQDYIGGGNFDRDTGHGKELGMERVESGRNWAWEGVDTVALDTAISCAPSLATQLNTGFLCSVSTQ